MRFVKVIGPVCVGGGVVAVTVNVVAPDVPPPGAPFTTVTLALPAVAISAAVIWAVSCVAET